MLKLSFLRLIHSTKPVELDTDSEDLKLVNTKK